MKLVISGMSLREKVWSWQIIKKAIKRLGQPQNIQISLSMIDKKTMQNLNLKSRKIDSVTDVLSFPTLDLKAGEIIDIKKEISFDNHIFLGDVVLCKDQIKKQAKDFGLGYKYEMQKMILHSLLHLLGYDHIEEEDYKLMQDVENKIFVEKCHSGKMSN